MQEGAGSIHGQKAKILYASPQKKNKHKKNKQTNKKTQNIKQKQYCNKFNNNFENGRLPKKKKKTHTYTKKTLNNRLFSPQS